MLPKIAAVNMGGLSQQTFGLLAESLGQLRGGQSSSGAPYCTCGGDQSPLPIPGEPLSGGYSGQRCSGSDGQMLAEIDFGEQGGN